MKSYIIFFFFLISLKSFSQMTREVWTGIGAKTKLSPKSELAIDINTRSYSYFFQLFYPEITYKYKLNKWIKPSIDYRLLDQRNKYGSFSLSNRLNFNVEFEKTIQKKIGIGFRIRYQSTFTRIIDVNNYDADFSTVIRLKPSLTFTPKKSKMSYNSAVEFFYNPQNVQLGRQFVKYRASFGIDINLKGPNIINLKYLYGQNINSDKNKSQHVLSIGYTFEWKKKSGKEEI
jgi:hypothetical protein